MFDPSQFMKDVCEYAEEAGNIILEYYVKKNYTILQKSDNSPRTEADWDAHLLILEKLQKLASFEVISEESFDASAPIPKEKNFWLVDPLDGTKEFLNRTGDFTVNIALVDGNYPVLGVIYLPVKEELFFASHNQGAFKRVGKGPLKKIHTHTMNKDRPRLLVSRNKPEERFEQLQKWPQAEITRMGSSLKYCRIAEGSADIYVRRLVTAEWDTAAAQCILEEAGGKLCDLSGQRLRYRKTSLLNEGLAAFGDRALTMKDVL